jgi:hypothetical protein
MKKAEKPEEERIPFDDALRQISPRQVLVSKQNLYPWTRSQSLQVGWELLRGPFLAEWRAVSTRVDLPVRA